MDRDEDRCPFSNSNVQSHSPRDVAVIEPRLNDRIASCLKVHLDSLCDIQDYNILPQSCWSGRPLPVAGVSSGSLSDLRRACGIGRFRAEMKKALRGDRKSTRLNSSHSQISYAVFCLKKKKTQIMSSYITRLESLAT